MDGIYYRWSISVKQDYLTSHFTRKKPADRIFTFGDSHNCTTIVWSIWDSACFNLDFIKRERQCKDIPFAANYRH